MKWKKCTPFSKLLTVSSSSLTLVSFLSDSLKKWIDVLIKGDLMLTNIIFFIYIFDFSSHLLEIKFYIKLHFHALALNEKYMILIYNFVLIIYDRGNLATLR